MKVHYFQHVPFEGLGSIEKELTLKGNTLTNTKLFEEKIKVSENDIDWLIVMGGPMGIYDEHLYPWLKDEKKFIKNTIEAGKKVLGICLGAQLIADVLKAKVYKNKHREIGWFPITAAAEINKTVLSGVLPEKFEAFHWHGDTFDIPYNAVPLGESQACKNQGFVFDNRVLAFQFHLETTFDSAAALAKNCANELDGSKYVQTEKEIFKDILRFEKINLIMRSVLNVFEKTYK